MYRTRKVSADKVYVLDNNYRYSISFGYADDYAEKEMGVKFVPSEIRQEDGKELWKTSAVERFDPSLRLRRDAYP